MLALPGHTSEQRTGKNQNNSLKGKTPYKFLYAGPAGLHGRQVECKAVGITNSFLRRYIVCNIFNIVVVGDDDDGTGETIDKAQTKTILDLLKKANVGPKFLKYMNAQSVGEAGSLEAAVATIAARDYRKAISTLEEHIAKAG
jgi:hypothetical protein